MRIWEYSLQQITMRLDCNQFRFLTNAPAEPYLAVLIALYRARQEEMQLEMPFEVLYERVAPILQNHTSNGEYDRQVLRSQLNMLVDWGNVSMRLEPRRIRRIQDRGLERYLVRLTETTGAILGQLESHVESIRETQATSAKFSLQDVDDFLSAVVDVMAMGNQAEHDDLCRAGRQLARARTAVEEAGDELLRLDLWLSEMAIQTPDRDRLTDLLTHLQAYFERYLQELDQRRQRCHEKLLVLLDGDAVVLFDRVRAAVDREYEEDPTRKGSRPPDPRQIVRTVQEFLEPDGMLDRRRNTVHERLADVTGHLKRFLVELVRRSQLLVGLRELSDQLLLADKSVFQNGRVERFLLNLWQPGHTVFDENRGKPSERVEPPRPPRFYVASGHRFRGASIRPSENGKATSRKPALIKQMQEVNAFVYSAVLHGQQEAMISDAHLKDWTQVKLLFSAIRMARLDKSGLRRRYLAFDIALPTIPKAVTLEPSDGSGILTLPQMVVSRGA